jgi:hypothetical protein
MIHVISLSHLHFFEVIKNEGIYVSRVEKGQLLRQFKKVSRFCLFHKRKSLCITHK